MAQLPQFAFCTASVALPSPEEEDYGTDNDKQQYGREIHVDLPIPFWRCLTTIRGLNCPVHVVHL